MKHSSNDPSAIIEALKMDINQLQSDVIIATQNYEHIKELWEADKLELKEAIKKYINKYNELTLREKDIKAEEVRKFAKFLIDQSGTIERADLPDYVKEFLYE